MAIISARRVLYGFSICHPMCECSLPVSWSTINLIISAIYIFSQASDNDILSRTCFRTNSTEMESILLPNIWYTDRYPVFRHLHIHLTITRSVFLHFVSYPVQRLDDFQIVFLVAVSQKKSIDIRVDSLLSSIYVMLRVTFGPFFILSPWKLFSPFT